VIHGKADYLPTDGRHFDHLYGKRIAVSWWCGRRGILGAGDGVELALSPCTFPLVL
jgi:hypothetical protein